MVAEKSDNEDMLKLKPSSNFVLVLSYLVSSFPRAASRLDMPDWALEELNPKPNVIRSVSGIEYGSFLFQKKWASVSKIQKMSTKRKELLRFLYSF